MRHYFSSFLFAAFCLISQAQDSALQGSCDTSLCRKTLQLPNGWQGVSKATSSLGNSRIPIFQQENEPSEVCQEQEPLSCLVP